MKQTEKIYRSIPFWSWNDELDPDELVKQVEWMDENGIGGFFMRARGGLKTEYLGEKWFECIKACSEKAEELGMGKVEAEVGVRWSSEGFWLPEYVEIKHGYNASLSEYIKSELGIASEKQKWC